MVRLITVRELVSLWTLVTGHKLGLELTITSFKSTLREGEALR